MQAITILLRRLGGVAAFLTLAAMGAPAFAYTAFAISSDLAYGYCSNAPSAEAARTCALDNCRSNAAEPDGCDARIESEAPGAYALAIGEGRWGVGSGATAEQAESKALGYCQSEGCTIVARWVETAGAPEFETQQPLELDDAAGTVVVIAMHGSDTEDSADVCHLDQVDVWQGLSSAIASLDGDTIADLPVVVDRFCTPHKLGTASTLKIELRAGDIAERVQAYLDAGVPGEHIFLAGHSAGGWSSLLVKQREPEAVNAVIAVSPAFAGESVTRSDWWQTERERQLDELAGAPDLASLVFAIEGDAFETPESLAPLSGAAGVDFVPITTDELEAAGCMAIPHLTYDDPCFGASWGGTIRDFIESRLQ